MANTYNTVYYIGMTNSIRRRMWEHRTRRNPRSFTARYNIHKLLYTERYPTPWEAICREKKLKRWKRAWKDALIEKQNPGTRTCCLTSTHRDRSHARHESTAPAWVPCPRPVPMPLLSRHALALADRHAHRLAATVTPDLDPLSSGGCVSPPDGVDR